MKPMKPASTKTLTWLAAMLTVTACLVMSPSGSLLLSLTAALAALVPAVFGRGRVRLVAAVLLLLALGLALGQYPTFIREQALYRQHQAPSMQQNPPSR